MKISPSKALVTSGFVARVAVVEQRSITPHEVNREPLEEVVDGDRLLLPGVPGQGAPKLFHLSDGALVPCTKTLHRKWQKDDSLVVAGLPGLVYLSLVGNIKSVARLCCSPCHQACLQGVHNGNVKSRVFTAGVVWDEHIGNWNYGIG